MGSSFGTPSGSSSKDSRGAPRELLGGALKKSVWRGKVYPDICRGSPKVGVLK